jgi:hypothetical protein
MPSYQSQQQCGRKGVQQLSMQYLDFDIEIGNGTAPDYPVAVLKSPGGEAHATMHFPLKAQELEDVRNQLRVALLATGDGRREASQAVQAFGQRLFEALFSGEVRSRYDVSQVLAFQQDAGLRLRLRIEPPELALIPWEYLYDSRPGEYLCLIKQSPLVRYLSLPQPIRPLSVHHPLRILGMVATPKNRPALFPEQEQAYLEEATRELRTQGLVELTWLEGQTWRDIQQAMQGGPWHIFHFIGHGTYDHSSATGALLLVNESGKAEKHAAEHMGRLLADHRSLRLVVLNACQSAQANTQELFSSTAATLVRRGIPAVLAMQNQVSDQTAIEMTRSLYSAVARRLPIDEAVTEARKAISFSTTYTLEWGTPVLYMRSPDGALFDSPAPVYEERLQKPSDTSQMEHTKKSVSSPYTPHNRTSTFISFSKADKHYFKQLQLFLAPFKRTGEISYWDPTQLEKGAKTAEVIAQAIASTKVAILLVSPAFFAEDALVTHQLRPLLDAAARQEVRIISVIVRDCAFEESELAQYEPVNRNQPVNKMPDYRQDTMWKEVAQLVRDILNPS